MNIRNMLQESYDESLLFADGFDTCIIGICEDFGVTRVVYCVEKMTKHLISEGLPYEEAMEYLSFNTLNAWVGKQTPIYMEPEECFTT